MRQKKKQDEFDESLDALKVYPARGKKNYWSKKFFKWREKIIEGFENKIFLLNYDDEGEQMSRYKEEENNIRDNNRLNDCKKLNRAINLLAKDINNKLVRRHFQVQDLVLLLEKLAIKGLVHYQFL